MTYHFRPHHFLCTLCFQGSGYSPAFIANFTEIVAEISANPQTLIQITAETDDICKPCPHRKETVCRTEKKIAVLDHAHASTLNFNIGETLTWDEAKNRIKNQLSLEQFHQMCRTCSWKKSGLCEKILIDFLANTNE